MLRYGVTTALAYPLIVLGLTWCLNLRATRSPAAAAFHGAAPMKKRGNEPAPRITRRGLMLLGLQAGVVGALGWRMRELQIVQNEHYRAARRGEPRQHPADPAGPRPHPRPRPGG